MNYALMSRVEDCELDSIKLLLYESENCLIVLTLTLKMFVLVKPLDRDIHDLSLPIWVKAASCSEHISVQFSMAATAEP